ncbi:MAG: tyrosine-type recombinase/integrase [Rhodospirillaceae bacterium]
MAAYHAALNDQAPPREIGASRTEPGTVSAVVVAYFNSGAFQGLSPSTQTTYRGILEAFRRDNGHRRIALLERRHIESIISNRAKTPAAANNLLRMLRTLMQFACANGFRRDDPTIGVKSVRTRTAGFYTWSEADIAKYEARHPIGSRARLAFALLLHTAQRRSDVVKMGRQHVRNGVLTIRQQKTGMLVVVRLRDELRAIIEATPNDQLTFLVAAAGKPFSAAGFGNLFRQWCDQAGLPKGCASHGLRKAASRRMAEAGCTAHEIMAITGHVTLKEVTRYTAAADREQLAERAIEKITSGTSSGKP